MRLLSFLLVIALVISACGGDKAEKTAEEQQAESVQDAIAAGQKAMQNLKGGSEGGEPVDHRSLKEMLKENVRDFNRTEYGSQSAGAMGFKMSNAEATYETSDGRRVEVSITDTGGMGMALAGLAAWSSVEVDREDSNGWERTGTFMGYKSFEKFTKSNQQTELAMIIEDRFIVVFNGMQCDMEDLKDFAKEIEIGELKKLI